MIVRIDDILSAVAKKKEGGAVEQGEDAETFGDSRDG